MTIEGGLLTAAAAGPVPLKRLLTELDAELESAGVSVQRSFEPGLSRSAVITLLDSVGLPAAEELIIYFGWHNGARPDLIAQALPFRRPIGLEQAAQYYSSARSAPFDVPAVPAGWLPLETDLMGLFVEATDLNRQGPRVAYVDPEEPPLSTSDITRTLPLLRSLSTWACLTVRLLRDQEVTLANGDWQLTAGPVYEEARQTGLF